MAKITIAQKSAAADIAIEFRTVGTADRAAEQAQADARTARLNAYVNTYRKIMIDKITTGTATVAVTKDDQSIPEDLRFRTVTELTYLHQTAQIILVDGPTVDAWQFAGTIKAMQDLKRNLRKISDKKVIADICARAESTAQALEMINEAVANLAAKGESDKSDAEETTPDLLTLLTSALTTYRAACKMIADAPEEVTSEEEDLVKAFGGLSLAALNAVEAAQVAALKAEQSA